MPARYQIPGAGRRRLCNGAVNSTPISTPDTAITNPWIIVAVGFVALSVSFAFRAVIGLSIPEWERSFGWSRDTISAASALALSVMACVYPAVGALIDRAGARTVLSAGCLLLALAMTLVGRPKPSEVQRVSLAQATRILFRDPGFHALLISFFICGITTTGIIETHFIPFAIACGFAPMLSAMSYSVLSGFNFAGMAISGWASDRYNRAWMLGGIYAMRGLSFFILLNVGNDFPMLILFAIVFGLMEYSTFPPTAGLVAARYGVANMGKAMGFLMAGHSVGAALGAWGAGRIFTVFGSYDWAWIGCALTAFGAGAVVLACKDPRHTGPNSGFRLQRVSAAA